MAVLNNYHVERAINRFLEKNDLKNMDNKTLLMLFENKVKTSAKMIDADSTIIEIEIRCISNELMERLQKNGGVPESG